MGCADCCILPKESREPTRYDPDFNGPIHKRSCTDIFWLILFILFLGVWGFVGFYGAKHGNIEKLLAPIDTEGRRCGLDSGVEDKRYLVFFDIVKCLTPGSAFVGCPTRQVCVKECPRETVIFSLKATEMQANFEAFRNKMVCTHDVDISTLNAETAQNYIKQEKCASYVINSQPVLQRCFVNAQDTIGVMNQIFETLEVNGTELVQQIADVVRFDQLSAQIVQDLVQSRWYLVGALLGVVVLCFIYILLLRWIVGPVVWASIIGLLGLLGFCTYLCYKNYVYYSEHVVSMVQTTNVKGYFEWFFYQKETWMALLIAVAVVLLILALIVIFLRSRISIAIALIREGSKAVSAVKTSVFFPIIPWILQCLVVGCGVVVLMFLMSIGESTFKVVNLQNDTNCNCQDAYTKDYESCVPETFTQSCKRNDGSGLPCELALCHFTGLETGVNVMLMHLANLLGFFWAMFFISGVSDMMLASTFSTWYWTYNKRDLPFFTLTAGVCRTLRYHLGTVAFGSLIIAIVRVIRVILEYIDHKIKKFDNPFTRCIMCFCKCFCWCLENFLKFINKNAYIMCAVHGQNFCKSARDAFSLLMRNIVRVVVLDKVTDFLFFLSKLLISIGVGVGVYYLLQWQVVYDVTQGQPLHYNYIPAIILSVATYFICTLFFNVYQMAVDTLFLCFLEDCERNDGSPEKPYFMSQNLMKILGKKNKKVN